MDTLTDNDKEVYALNFENDMKELLGNYAIFFGDDKRNSKFGRFESSKIRKLRRLSDPDAQMPFGIEDESIVTISEMHQKNLAKLYVEEVDNPKFSLDIISNSVWDRINEIHSDIIANPEIELEILVILDCLKKFCGKFMRLPKKPVGSKDWMYTPLELLKQKQKYVKAFYGSNPKVLNMVDQIASKITLSANCNDNSEKFQSTTILIRFVVDHLCCFHMKAIGLKIKKLETLEMKTKEDTDNICLDRKVQLIGHGFSEEKADCIVQSEFLFLSKRVYLKNNPLPECYGLDSILDEDFIPLCRFDKLTVRYLAFILNIPPSIIDRSEAIAKTAKNNIVETKVANNAAFMLAICLARITTRSSLNVIGLIFKISKTAVSNITKCIVNHIFIHFSHLFNIDNCSYNNNYLKLLVEKSKTQLLPGVRENTTHMIDGTHTKISKPTNEDGSCYDPTFDGSKHSDTVAYQVLTDNMGLFVDMTPASLGALHDMAIFRSSGIKNRLPKLKFENMQLNVVGDSAYVLGSPVFNETTEMFDSNSFYARNLYGVPKRGSVKGLRARNSQKNISKVRVVIERSFGYRNNLFKFLSAKERQKLHSTAVNREGIVSALLANVGHIMFNNACSNLISDVLPPDLYLLMWGSLSDRKPLASHF